MKRKHPAYFPETTEAWFRGCRFTKGSPNKTCKIRFFLNWAFCCCISKTLIDIDSLHLSNLCPSPSHTNTHAHKHAHARAHTRALAYENSKNSVFRNPKCCWYRVIAQNEVEKVTEHFFNFFLTWKIPLNDPLDFLPKTTFLDFHRLKLIQN